MNAVEKYRKTPPLPTEVVGKRTSSILWIEAYRADSAIAELEAENKRLEDEVGDEWAKRSQAESELHMLNEAEQLNYERILQLKAENEPLKVCGTCARCRATGVCQSDWPLREYATAHSTAHDLHSKCWRGGALGWVAYWTEPEEEKKNVLADMEATGYQLY